MPRTIGSSRFWLLFGAVALVAGGVSYYFGLHRGRNTAQQNVVVEVKDPQSGRVPGEFEHQDALLLGCNELIEYHPETLVQIVQAIKDNVRIVGLVKNEEQQERVDALLRSRDILPNDLVYFVWPSEMMWVQDYGPFFVVNGSATVIDFEYHHPNTDLENLFPLAFAARFRMPFTHARMAFDGGNLLSNGKGLCISTTSILQDNAERHLAAAVDGLLATPAPFALFAWEVSYRSVALPFGQFVDGTTTRQVDWSPTPLFPRATLGRAGRAEAAAHGADPEAERLAPSPER